MLNRFAGYFAATNRAFLIRFPLFLLAAASMRYSSDKFYWLVPATIAAIEAIAKAYEIWKRKQGR
jgi:hypothetical protein